MMIACYPTKKELKTQIGQKLKYRETSIFGMEFIPNGTFVVSNRPHLTGYKREFFASITMKNGVIARVS